MANASRSSPRSTRLLRCCLGAHSGGFIVATKSRPCLAPAVVPSSITPLQPDTSAFPARRFYVASKFAVIGLSKTAALEFARQGIRVNSVSPGPIQTEMFDRASGEGETEMKKTIATQTLVGRVGTPEEIASAVLWLSSPGAAFITGQDVIVDGGYTAQ